MWPGRPRPPRTTTPSPWRAGGRLWRSWRRPRASSSARARRRRRPAPWQTLDDKRGLARAFSQVGLCYVAQNVLPEGEQNLQQALQLWEDLNDPPEQAEILIRLGFMEYRKGEWSNSINFHTQAQRLIDEKAEPEKMGQVAAGLAEDFNEYGLPETGLAHYGRALEYNRLTQDPRAIAFANFGLGWSYYLLGKYPEALAQFRQALDGVGNDDRLARLLHGSTSPVYIST